MATSERAAAVRLQSDLIAPAFLKVELTSSLLKYLRAGLLSGQSLRQAAEETEALIRNWRADDELLAAATGIAISRNHKIHDCLYLALALDRGAPIVTADRPMAFIARDIGIEAELVAPAL